ncbi:MAG: metal-sulfur cluster assembly factor [Myxococcota bacterium]
MKDPDVMRALAVVIDPELGIDIVSLGLVYEATREAGRVHVKMTMTSPACPLGESIVADAKSAIEALVPGARDIDVELVTEPRWTPELMSDDARAQLS